VIGDRTRFSSDELPIDGGRVTAPEIAASMAVARELDALVMAETPAPTPDFASRVMAAVAAEPAPQPVTAFARALAGGRVVGMLAAVRDAWRVSTSAGRPTPVRAQALALVLLALLAFGSLAGISGAAIGLFDSRRPDPSSLPTFPAIVRPSPSSLRLPEDSPTPTPPPPTPDTSPDPTPSPKPTATVRPTYRATPRPAATPRRTASPQPTETDDNGHGGGGDSPSPTDNSGPGGGGG
jgi:hypothetical protein